MTSIRHQGTLHFPFVYRSTVEQREDVREMVARKAAPRKAAPATANRRTRSASRASEGVEEAPTRTRRTAAKPAAARRAAPAKRTAAKPAPVKAQRDVTQYADKEPTAYHKAYATWLVREVGVNIKGLSARDAFLLGVSTATAARNSFMDSAFLEEWREKNGVAKRGPKAAAEEKARRANRAVVSDDEFEPADDEADDDDFEEADEADSDDDFDDDASDDDDDFDDDSDADEADDDDDFEDEPEEAPKARTRRAPAKAAAAKPATRGTRRKAAASDEDDDTMLF